MAATRPNLAPRLPTEAPAREPHTPAVTLADDAAHAPRFSPARALQARLTAETSAIASDRWSPRATLLFVVTVCGAFWAAMGSALIVVLR